MIKLSWLIQGSFAFHYKHVTIQPLKIFYMLGAFLGDYIYLRFCPFDWSEK